jgi:hypothetical protein
MSETVATRNAILELERKITAVKLRTDTLDLDQVTPCLFRAWGFELPKTDFAWAKGAS